MSAFVRFWGTRGSIPTPGEKTAKYGGNTSCVELRFGDAVFICDGGTGLRELGMDLMRRPRAATGIHGHMFFSHPHWDHIQGVPFFTPAYDAKNTFHIYGPKEGDRRIFDLLSGQMSGEYFPVNFEELGARVLAGDLGPASSKVLDGVKVSACELKHPGKSYAFCFEAEGWKVVYATDNEIDLALEDLEQPVTRPAELRRVPRAWVDFMRGADLLIADAQYTDEEYPAKKGWGHSRATSVTDLGVQCGVKQLALYHHDPMHTDADVDRVVEQCRDRARALKSEVAVFAAREGVVLKIG